MTIKYILDTREKALQTLFNRANTPYETRQLDLGDILILYSKGEIVEQVSNDSNEAKLLKEEIKLQEYPVYSIIIERKSYTDLKASMSDNRYREQKSRYLKLPKRTVYYILENNDPDFAELGKKQFIGTYIHTMIRDGLGVFLTTSIEDTYEYITKIGETLEKFGFDLQEIGTSSESSAVGITQIKKKKAKGSEVYKQQLCCIPGISAGKAETIFKAYPDISSLIDSVKNDTFKVKGIGKVLSDNIKESIFPSIIL